MIHDRQTADQVANQLITGYWHVGGKYFFHKADCFRYATSIKNYNITYHYFDKIFQSIDWRKEPPQSLEQLYKDRAQQLRDKYKYIALTFSGGADSTNVLESFINNGIKLDEVVCYYPVEAVEKAQDKLNVNDKSFEYIHYEWLTACKPRLKWLAKVAPDVKITLLDKSSSFVDHVFNGEMTTVSQGGCNINLNMVNGHQVIDHVSQYGDSTCILHGHDKPQLVYDTINKRYNAYFHDFSMVHGRYPDYKSPLNHPAVEYFYLTPDMPQLTIKQSIAIKNAIEPIRTSQFEPFYSDVFKISKFNSTKIRVNSNSALCKTAMYASWDNSIYQVDKPNNVIFNDVFKHTIIDYKREKRFSDYLVGQVNEYFHGINPSLILKDDEGVISKLKDIFTTPTIL